MFFESDLLIVGAGPVGLFTAFQAGMLKINCIVIDSLSIIGGQCAMLYPEKPIYDIPAYPVITGLDLVNKLHEQMRPFDQKIVLNQKVARIEAVADECYLVHTKDSQYRVKSIILATGGGHFVPNRPPIEKIELFEGKSVFYSVTKMQDFADKTVVIAGGGDSAVDWAINLAQMAKHIYLVHRRDKFRAMQSNLEALEKLAKSGKVEMVVPYQLSEIKGRDGQIESVIVKSLEGQTRTLVADYLLPFFGIAMNNHEMIAWGLDLTQDRHYIMVEPSTMETNLKSIFAVGDVTSYPGKLRLILTGFAEAALAVHTAFTRINPGTALHFEHSTSKGVPKSL